MTPSVKALWLPGAGVGVGVGGARRGSLGKEGYALVECFIASQTVSDADDCSQNGAQCSILWLTQDFL